VLTLNQGDASRPKTAKLAANAPLCRTIFPIKLVANSNVNNKKIFVIKPIFKDWIEKGVQNYIECAEENSHLESIFNQPYSKDFHHGLR